MNEQAAMLTVWAPRVLSILRIVAALIFLEHGTQKLLGFPMGERAFVEVGTLSWWAGLIELVTGVLLVLGLFTRAAAFIASGEMAVAYWMAHAPQSFFPVNNGGDAAILYCFVFLYLVRRSRALERRRHPRRTRIGGARVTSRAGARCMPVVPCLRTSVRACSLALG